VKHVRARQPSALCINHRLDADCASRPRSTTILLRRGLRLPILRGHAELLVAALLPVLRLALGPAVAHELAAGAGAEGDAGLLGEAAVGALPAARQGLLRVGHVALRILNGLSREVSRSSLTL
jgi:hypothetical protein